MAGGEWLRPSEAAARLHVSYYTLRSYADKGLIGFERTPGGQRVFSVAELDRFMGRESPRVEDKPVSFYVRVSGQNGNLEAQLDRLTRAYGEPAIVYRDRASGLSENRRGLQRLMRDAREGRVGRVCVTARERLTRFGYSYLEAFLEDHGVVVSVLDDERDIDLHEELMRDFMSLIASFSGKYYKLRSLKHERMLLERAGQELETRVGAGHHGKA